MAKYLRVVSCAARQSSGSAPNSRHRVDHANQPLVPFACAFRVAWVLVVMLARYADVEGTSLWQWTYGFTRTLANSQCVREGQIGPVRSSLIPACTETD